MAGWTTRQPGTNTQFIGAHTETLQTLTRLQLLVQLAPSMSRGQRQRMAAEIDKALWPLIKRHHQDEEQLLFPAMLQRIKGADRIARVKAYIARLTREHRAIEAVWGTIQTELANLARGGDTEINANACDAIMQFYRSHAQFEETVVLPLAADLLSGHEQDSISLSLALRHNVRHLRAYI